MKKLHKFSGLLLGIFLISNVSTTFAMIPPDYLRVNNWLSCLSKENIDSYSIVCLPKQRPSTCPTISWEQLHAMRDLPQCGKPI